MDYYTFPRKGRMTDYLQIAQFIAQELDWDCEKVKDDDDKHEIIESITYFLSKMFECKSSTDLQDLLEDQDVAIDEDEITDTNWLEVIEIVSYLGQDIIGKVKSLSF